MLTRAGVSDGAVVPGLQQCYAQLYLHSLEIQALNKHIQVRHQQQQLLQQLLAYNNNNNVAAINNSLALQCSTAVAAPIGAAALLSPSMLSTAGLYGSPANISNAGLYGPTPTTAAAALALHLPQLPQLPQLATNANVLDGLANLVRGANIGQPNLAPNPLLPPNLPPF